MFIVQLFIVVMNVPEFSPPDVMELVRKAQRGQREAVSSLYRLFAPKIFRYLIRRLPTTQDAEDVMGEVFVDMVKGLESYKDTGVPFEAWLYRIATNRTTDFYRRTKRAQNDELSEMLPDNEDLPEEIVINEQNLQAMRHAVQQLPEEYQTILILRFVERKTHEEAAQLIGKSVSAVRSLQFRALAQLADLLGHTKARHYIRGQNG
jgi:RNA polymerase sigma-70 factor, ECF subfamily